MKKITTEKLHNCFFTKSDSTAQPSVRMFHDEIWYWGPTLECCHAKLILVYIIQTCLNMSRPTYSELLPNL
jgi:hypothetical protein